MKCAPEDDVLENETPSHVPRMVREVERNAPFGERVRNRCVSLALHKPCKLRIINNCPTVLHYTSEADVIGMNDTADEQSRRDLHSCGLVQGSSSIVKYPFLKIFCAFFAHREMSFFKTFLKNVCALVVVGICSTNACDLIR